MVVCQSCARSNGSIVEEILRAVSPADRNLSEALEFLFANAGSMRFQDLRIEPLVAAHRNLVSAEPFLLPKERFGGSEDVAMVPLLRGAVDDVLRAYAGPRPHLAEYVGKTPISPYGSMGLSVNRWGNVDWDYVRDLDWRIFLPPELGHVSGFKPELERVLTEALQKFGLHPILGGKDEQGLHQVQLRDTRTALPHGFHFFLIAMKPGYLRGNIHHDGGYSPHFSYFPEGSLDEHLESANLLWSNVIEQQREDYIAMFDQLSFNIFGENTAKNRLYKTRGWYLHKAFKWYATLARMRGLSALELDLLYEYEHYRGSEAELSYFARYRYYARLAPSRPRLDDVDRDLARAASVAYARARSSEDALVGQQISVDGADYILMETASGAFAVEARKLLDRAQPSLPEPLKRAPITGPIHFADNLPAPFGVNVDGHGQAGLIPAEWSMVFCDSYVRRVAKRAEEENRSIAEDDVHEALVTLLASLLWQASAAGVVSAEIAGPASAR
jgi:hypothetical protein